VQGSQFNKKQF